MNSCEHILEAKNGVIQINAIQNLKEKKTTFCGARISDDGKITIHIKFLMLI